MCTSIESDPFDGPSCLTFKNTFFPRGITLDDNSIRMEKGSLTYKAMTYTLNQWEKLTVYCEDGHLAISSAAAENAIRPCTIGRNWLFADTPKGACASAIYYSLIESAKLNGLEPFAYIYTTDTAKTATG